MKIPYVIDNQAHRLADVLNSILGQHAGRSLDVATAYFTVGGFGLLRPGLESLGSLRLILGAETLSAMANADGGELVVGMEDDGEPRP